MINYINKDQIPYLKTEPFHIVFRSKASLGILQGGYYDWGVNTNALQPSPNGLVVADPRVDLNPQHLYVIENFTFSADIAEQDFSGAIIDSTSAPENIPTIPRFNLSVQSEATGVIIKQPIPLPQYYQGSTFPKWRVYTKEASDLLAGVNGGAINGPQYLTLKNTNQFQGSFQGRLQQTTPLIGKGTITLIIAFNLLEIADENFIREYRAETAADRRNLNHG